MNAGIFDHFDDPLEDTINATLRDPHPRPTGGVTERCGKCGGTGQTRWGPCRCKGSGKLTFVNDAATRATNRAKGEQRRAKRGDENLADFGAAHGDVYSWLLTKNTTFGFAASLLEQVKRRGELSEKQLEAARRCIANDKVREERRAAVRRDEIVIPMSSAKLRDAFAVAWGHTKAGTSARKKDPFLVAFGLKFKPAPLHGKNPGSIYVSEHRGDKHWIGTLLPDETFRPRAECTPAHEQNMRETLDDPKAAAEVQARLYSYCGVCGRTLTNHKSIDRGIGPICYGRMGW